MRQSNEEIVYHSEKMKIVFYYNGFTEPVLVTIEIKAEPNLQNIQSTILMFSYDFPQFVAGVMDLSRNGRRIELEWKTLAGFTQYWILNPMKSVIKLKSTEAEFVFKNTEQHAIWAALQLYYKKCQETYRIINTRSK